MNGHIPTFVMVSMLFTISAMLCTGRILRLLPKKLKEKTLFRLCKHFYKIKKKMLH